MLVFISGKTFEGQTQLKEKWYGTDYSNNALDNEVVTLLKAAHYDDEKFSGALQLPDRNDLIATDFKIHEDHTALPDEPQLLMDNSMYRVW